MPGEIVELKIKDGNGTESGMFIHGAIKFINGYLYSYRDCFGCPIDRRSIDVYCLLIDENLIIVAARSSAEADFCVILQHVINKRMNLIPESPLRSGKSIIEKR